MFTLEGSEQHEFRAEEELDITSWSIAVLGDDDVGDVLAFSFFIPTIFT